jgi:hypothetical protein
VNAYVLFSHQTEKRADAIFTICLPGLGNLRDARSVPLYERTTMNRIIENKYRAATLKTATAALLVCFSPRLVGANLYVQHNLVSDIPGLADQTDPRLVNPWGFPPAQPARSGLQTIAPERRPYTMAPVNRSRPRRRSS